MNCIIDVGGGNRGVYGAGVFERCLDDDVRFDCCIGVSAGSANMITYLARQKGRLYTFYHDYSFRQEYMSLPNLFKTGEFIGLDYVYGTLSTTGGEYPLDYEEVQNYEGIMEIVATQGQTGNAEYFNINDVPKDDYWALRASCCIPLVCKPVQHGDFAYFDGGVADPVPIDRALQHGADKIVLILTKPLDFVMKRRMDGQAANMVRSRFPALAKKLDERAERYNSSVQKAIQLSKEGRCLIIAPDDLCGVGMLTKTPKSIDALYHKAYEDAGCIKNFLK